MADKRRSEYIERIRKATIDIYGSWYEFVASGAIKIDPASIIPKSRDDLVGYAKELAEKLGRAPKKSEFSSAFSNSVAKATIDEFGTWHNFLKVVGLDVDKDVLIQHIQSLVKDDDHEYTPSRADFKKKFGDRESSVIEEEFGSWNNFLKQAGIATMQENIRQIELKEIRNLANELGHIPSITEIRSMLEDRVYNRLKLFGGYENTIVRAYTDMSAEEAMSIFSELTKKLGRIPTKEQFRNELCAWDEGCFILCEAGMWYDIGRCLLYDCRWHHSDGWHGLFGAFYDAPEFEVVKEAFRDDIKKQFCNTGLVPTQDETEVSGWPASYFLDQSLDYHDSKLGRYDYAWASLLFDIGLASDVMKEFMSYPGYEVMSLHRNYERLNDFEAEGRNGRIYRYALAFGIDVKKYLERLGWPV